MKGFVDNLPELETQWDVITGVSVGSINAAAIALHEVGKEKDAIDWMVGLWSKFGKTDIYRNWNFGPIQGLFFKEGLWNNQAEADYLKEQFQEFPDKTLKRRVNINTVDIDTGEIYKYNETMDFETIPVAVRASTSMPFAFPHTKLDGHAFVDGGSAWNIDLSGAIQRCKEVVDDDEDIIVDIVMCNGATLIPEKEHQDYNTVHNYGRLQQIRSYYSTMSDYCEVKRGFPKVNFRYVIAPDGELPGGFLPLDFDHDTMLSMIQIGIKDAEQAINDERNVFEDAIRDGSADDLCAKDDE